MTAIIMVIIFALVVLFGCVVALSHVYMTMREDFDKQHVALQNLISNAKNAFEGSKTTVIGEQK